MRAWPGSAQTGFGFSSVIAGVTATADGLTGSIAATGSHKGPVLIPFVGSVGTVVWLR